MGEVGGIEGKDEGKDGGGKEEVLEEIERTSTRDGVDVCFKLRYSAKITFDMNASPPDNEIKVVLFYKCVKDVRSKILGSNAQN